MKLVYANNMVTDMYMDYISDDVILVEHPGADLLSTTKIVNKDSNGYLAEVQQPDFNTETGLEWDGTHWRLSEQKRKLINIEKAKHVARLKLADIDNPITGLKMSSETDKWAIERDLEHNSTNMLMIFQQDSTSNTVKSAILSAQAQGIAILAASKQVYAEISANTDYNYANNALWP